MRKPSLAVLLGAVVLATLTGVPLAPAQAATTTTLDGITYTVDATTMTATVTEGALVGPSIVIPAQIPYGGSSYTVTAIGPEAYKDRGHAYTSLSLPTTVTSIGSGAFRSADFTTLTVPDSVVSIGNEAFTGIGTLTSLTLGTHLQTIGDQAFRNASITTVSIPDSVRTIGALAFAKTLSDHPSLSLDLGTGVISIGPSAFAHTWIKHLVIPDSVTMLGTAAFENSILETLTLGEGLTSIGERMFSHDSIYGEPLSALRIPAGVTEIGDYAFSGSRVESLTFTGTNLTTIGVGAFWVNHLTSLALPDGLTTLGDRAFNYGAVTSLSLPASLTTIPTSAFEANALTSLTLPDTVTTIGARAFADNPDLASLSLGNGVRTIGPTAFSFSPTSTDSGSLARLTMPASLVSIGGGAFARQSISTLTFGPNLTTIGGHAFYLNRLTSLALPGHVEEVGASAFSANLLASLSYDSATTVGMETFSHNKLTSVVIPAGTRTVAPGLFRNNELTHVTLPSTLTQVGAQAFLANKLTDVRLPPAVTEVGYQAFVSNALSTIRMTGMPPALGSQALPEGTQVRFPWKFGESQIAGGYKTPVWKTFYATPVASVTFDPNGAHSAAPSAQEVDVSSVAERPADPTKVGHRFTGWFTDAAATVPFTFTTPVGTDLTLYAGFADAPPPAVIDPLRFVVAPRVSGTPAEGATLSAAVTLSPARAVASYRWLSNGAVIPGATAPTLRLAPALTGTAISVQVTARVPGMTALTRTSARTALVSSTALRLRVSTTVLAKGQPLGVVATGFAPRQKVTIALGGKVRWRGKADARGIVVRTIGVPARTKPGRHRLQVSGLRANGKVLKSIKTKIRRR